MKPKPKDESPSDNKFMVYGGVTFNQLSMTDYFSPKMGVGRSLGFDYW